MCVTVFGEKRTKTYPIKRKRSALKNSFDPADASFMKMSYFATLQYTPITLLYDCLLLDVYSSTYSRGSCTFLSPYLSLLFVLLLPLTKCSHFASFWHSLPSEITEKFQRSFLLTLFNASVIR